MSDEAEQVTKKPRFDVVITDTLDGTKKEFHADVFLVVARDPKGNFDAYVRGERTASPVADVGILLTLGKVGMQVAGGTAEKLAKDAGMAPLVTQIVPPPAGGPAMN